MKVSPEIVVWKEGSGWVVGVELTAEIMDRGATVMDSEGNEIKEDHLRKRCYPLTDPCGGAIVRWKDWVSEKTSEWYYSADERRTFQLTESGMDGRCVSQVKRGAYLVIGSKAAWQPGVSKAEAGFWVNEIMCR